MSSDDRLMTDFFPPTPASFVNPRSNVPLAASPPDSQRDHGDGFTAFERRKVSSQPLTKPWIPPQKYEDVDIEEIVVPGPGCRRFMGRIVNFFNQASSGKAPMAAKGCVKMMIKDNTGVISVRLWYARPPSNLRLGHLVTIWTTHISDGEQNKLAPQSAPLFTSIFPERDRGCHFTRQEHDDDGALCKAPLNYKIGRALSGLMNLKNFIFGGHEVNGARILVVVKSVSEKTKVANKRGGQSERVRAKLFDDSADATLTLWGAMCESALAWQASHTVLLISNPGTNDNRPDWLSLNASTMVDVDPDIPDTTWLRGYAQRLTQREHVCPEFPFDVSDFNNLMTSQQRIRFTLADLDEFARAAPSERFIGFMSVIIMELNLVDLFRRNMVMCNECCGAQMFSNETLTICEHCKKWVALRMNPRVLGAMIDETGSTTCGSVVVSEVAWQSLFGRPAYQLLTLGAPELKNIEQRVLFLRVTLVFGWAREEPESNVGRLCVWDFHP